MLSNEALEAYFKESTQPAERMSAAPKFDQVRRQPETAWALRAEGRRRPVGRYCPEAPQKGAQPGHEARHKGRFSREAAETASRHDRCIVCEQGAGLLVEFFALLGCDLDGGTLDA